MSYVDDNGDDYGALLCAIKFTFCQGLWDILGFFCFTKTDLVENFSNFAFFSLDYTRHKSINTVSSAKFATYRSLTNRHFDTGCEFGVAMTRLKKFVEVRTCFVKVWFKSDRSTLHFYLRKFYHFFCIAIFCKLKKTEILTNFVLIV